jgi:hypothetical protein
MKNIIAQLISLIEATPVTTFVQAVQEIGLGNMCGISDLARLRKIFFDWERAGNKSGSYVIPSERPYFWSNEYIGIASEGHSASGKIICAKVADIDPTRRPHETINVIFGHVGQIIVSEAQYTLCPEWKLDDICYLAGFREGDHGIHVPVPDLTRGRRVAWGTARTPFGPLYVKDLNGLDFFPVTMRPASWHADLVFTNTDSTDCAMKAIPKGKLREILQSIP